MEGGIPDHNFSPKAGDVKYRDLNGDYKIDDKDVAAIGYPKYPLLTGNMSLGFSWNGLDFSMVWSGAFKTSRLVSSFYRVPFDTTNNRALLSYMIKATLPLLLLFLSELVKLTTIKIPIYGCVMLLTFV